MEKWYERVKPYDGAMISSRIRFARNLKDFPFSGKLSPAQASQVLKTLTDSFFLQEEAKGYQWTKLNQKSKKEKLPLMERHMISPMLVEKLEDCGVIYNEEESVSILINEEDHIRIQAVVPGEDIDRAFEIANKMDDLLEEKVSYAFDNAYGYLTACPTNVGTGMRASYMVHLPFLEKTGQMTHIVQAVSKFGITVRGIYGEGSSSMGAIYQISNQITLGRTEEEIIKNLKNVTNLVLEQEKRMQEKVMSQAKLDFYDKVYRSFGILTNARKISAEEAMNHLSNVWTGYQLGILQEPAPDKNIYSIMMEIQPGFLFEKYSAASNPEKQEIARANDIRAYFSKKGQKDETGREAI